MQGQICSAGASKWRQNAKPVEPRPKPCRHQPDKQDGTGHLADNQHPGGALQFVARIDMRERLGRHLTARKGVHNGSQPSSTR